VSRAPHQGLVWGAVALVLVGVSIAGAISLWKGRAAAPPGAALSRLGDYGAVPDFELTERDGRTIRREALDGEIWIADFIFTRCTGICPILSARMLGVRRGLGGRKGVRLVSFSVDPDFDTPEVLAEYARLRGVDGEDWLFLTGKRDALYRLIGEGFKLGVAAAPPEQEVAPGELITHSDRIVLVDRTGRIRAYFHGTEEGSAEKILEAVRDLEAEGGA
jgi:protein SCO1/2